MNVLLCMLCHVECSPVSNFAKFLQHGIATRVALATDEECPGRLRGMARGTLVTGSGNKGMRVAEWRSSARLTPLGASGPTLLGESSLKHRCHMSWQGGAAAVDDMGRVAHVA